MQPKNFKTAHELWSAASSGDRACVIAAGDRSTTSWRARWRLRTLLDAVQPRSPHNSHHTPIVECADSCLCPPTCLNRVVSRGLRVSLTVFWTRDGRGWGVRAAQPLRRGQFVCEYAGEILSSAERWKEIEHGNLKRTQGRTVHHGSDAWTIRKLVESQEVLL